MVLADLQRNVLDASVALIEERGVTALSLREVARRAGVSHQAPYHHFGDREGILAAIAEEGFTKLRERMVKGIEGVTAPRDRLTAVGEAYVDFAIGHPGHFQVMFRADLIDLGRYETLRARGDATFNLLLSVVSEIASQRGSDPMPLAVAAWSLAHGLSTLLLEGKLAQRLGNAKKRQREGAAAALAAFRDLLT